MSDIIYVARNIAAGVAGNVPSIASQIDTESRRRILPPEKIKNRFFLKISALDKPGVLARISGLLSEKKISISSIRQRERKKGDHVPILISTYRSYESHLTEALSALESMEEVESGSLVMRIIGPEA
jgi:homoserine dehydrogenase